MEKTFNIVRRAYGEYTQIETFVGTRNGATLHAMAVQIACQDGEYLVREPGQPNWSANSSYQSPMDWL